MIIDWDVLFFYLFFEVCVIFYNFIKENVEVFYVERLMIVELYD